MQSLARIQGKKMKLYNLTIEQKELLEIIIDHKNSGYLSGPIIPSCDHSGCQIIGIDKNLDQNLYGDLDALCDVGLLGVRINTEGDKIYTIKQLAYDAVTNNFIKPEQMGPTNVSIGAIINSMSGGNLQAIGISEKSEISQIVNDPELLHSQVEALAENLINEVKSSLNLDEFTKYTQSVQELKSHLLAGEPNPSGIRKLVKTIGLLGDIEGSVALMIRVWSYLHPLLMIAGEMLS